MTIRAAFFVAVSVLVLSGCESTAPWPESGVYAGYYHRWDREVSDFKPAGTTERWWLSATGAQAEAIRAKGVPLYLVVRGSLSKVGHYGHFGRYSREIVVTEVLEARRLGAGEAVKF